MDREIVKACVKCNNKLFTGFDHGECFERIEEDKSIVDARKTEQGFIDNEGNFIDRIEAMVIAEKAGQLRYKLGKKHLISEDLHLNWLNKQAKQLAYLEAKLAEKEKALNTISSKYEKKSEQIFKIIKNREECSNAYNLLSKENDQLKQQLAESEKFMQVNGFKTWKEAQEALNGKFECLFDEKHELWKKIVAENAQLKQQLAEKDAEVQSWKDGTMVVKLGKLEEQLAEKDKVIENLRIDLKDWQDLEEKLGTKYDKVVEQLADKEKYTYTGKEVGEIEKNYEIQISDLEQSQNQTAIAKLEKVVEFIKEYPHEPRYWDIASYIDQQIKSLKGETDGSTN